MTAESIIAEETIIRKIFQIRGQKVMLDKDLAVLYGVSTGNLNKAVDRNRLRFPEDFLFKLTEEEWENLKEQTETNSWGGTRKMPRVFTEQGVAMLSGVLNSHRAILVNIQIMRVYTKMRELLLTHKELLLRIGEMEKTLSEQDEKVMMVFNYLRQFIKDQETPRVSIGYKTE